MRFRILRVPVTCMYALVVATAFAIMAPQPVQAQNLVQNPNFASGLSGYMTTGTVAPEPFGGFPEVAFFAANNSTLSQAIATTPGITYTFTFMAAFDPGIADSALASFGTGSLPFSFAADQATGNPAQYSLTGTATSSVTDLSFTNTTGESYIVDLSVEANQQSAPAPIPGAGGLSFLVGLASLAGLRLLRRRQPLA